jgi:hypothetical protein
VAPRPANRGKQLPPIALTSLLAREDLPAPLVYYPNRYGAFFAFAATRSEPPALCACAEEPIHNLIRLAAAGRRLDPMDYRFFPDTIAMALAGQEDTLAALTFRPGLCHRCNQAPPSLRYCHEAEGQRFVQTYGWYINQNYLRLGIHPESHRYLPDVCPPECQEVLHRIQALTDQARSVRAQLAALMNSERREIPRAERSHWPNVTLAEAAPLEAIEQQLGKPRRELANAVQNLTRAEFGHRAIGEAWLSENRLHEIVCRLFPGETVVRHHRPEWMDGLELDLYLPGRKLAFEYQGQQHFHPIKAWGGEVALRDLQERDARKVLVCSQAGVRLVVVAYTEPLTDEHIRERLGHS